MNSYTLVTGGCGFVGRHLVNRLLNDNHHVVIVDNLYSGIHPDLWLDNSLKSNVTFHNLDARDFFASSKSFEQKFDNVFHLSAVVGGRIKIDKDPISVAQDLSIDSEFFNWTVKSKPEQILYASSSAAYPTNLQQSNSQTLLSEDMITFDGTLGFPDMTYGWSKLTGEYLSRLASKHYGLNIACIRPFSGYGEDQDKSYPVPAIGERAAKKEDPLIIWGTGKQSRDFVYIEDCIDAMLLAIEKITDGSAVNISSGKLTSFLEIAKIYADIAGYSPKIQPLDDMPEGVFARYGNTQKSKELLDWEPKTNLYDGLTIVYEYIKSKL
jgi:nucleoside-diphosphate-sugar epimerase